MLRKEVVYALRSLRKRSGFSLIILVTLAIGIGANTAVFTLVNAVLLKELPYPDPHQLVVVHETNKEQGKDDYPAGPFNFHQLKKQTSCFQNLSAFHKWNYNLTGAGDPERVQVVRADGQFFSSFQIQPLAGRLIGSNDTHADSEKVAVLGYSFWKSRFGGERSMIGKKILLDQSPYTVIGIAPQHFLYPDDTIQLWIPLIFESGEIHDRAGKYLRIVGRLKRQFSIAEAQTEVSAVSLRLSKLYPDTNRAWEARVVSLKTNEVKAVRVSLLVLCAAVGFLLLIACANVSSLVLMRATSRSGEFALRIALGATRSHLFRQMFVEGAILSIIGATVALIIAYWSVETFKTVAPFDLPRMEALAIDARVGAFTLGISTLNTLLFSIIPALTASQMDPQLSLRSQQRGVTRGKERTLHSSFVVIQLAIAVVLLTGAGIAIRSLIALQRVDPGFNSENVLTMRIWLPMPKYGENETQIEFFKRLMQEIIRIPGVRAAGAIQDLPLRKNLMSYKIFPENVAQREPGTEPEAAYRVVTPEYFRAMGIPLLQGRNFTQQDDADATNVVIVNQTLARKFWDHANPLGKRVSFGDGEDRSWHTVVGVVQDVKHMGLDAKEGPAFYQPHAQKRLDFLRWMTLVVQTKTQASTYARPVRQAVLKIDPQQPVYDTKTMPEVMQDSISRRRFSTFLLSIFSAVALLLAGVGTYGVIAYGVSQRTSEIAIRMAIGATYRDVLALIVRQGVVLTLAGLVIGVALSAGVTRWMSSLLFQISATDRVTFAAVAIILLLTAVFATYLPARRAARIAPLASLRYD